MAFTKVDIDNLAALRDFASSHVVSLEDLKKMMARELPPIGDDDRFVTSAGDYRVIFSHEYQPSGKCRHVSISNPKERDMEKWMVGFDAILKELGYLKPATDNIVWDERYDNTIAVNVIEMIS